MSLRDGPLGDIKVPLTWSAAAALVIAVVAALALLLSDRHETMKAHAYDTARRAVDAVAAPVGGVIASPVRWTGDGFGYVRSYFFAVSENRRLKVELAGARSLRDQMAAMRLENDRYRALLGVRTDPPLPMVFAHTVSDSRGPFANTRLADVGADKGVVEGNPVVSEHGVVGRIVGVAPHVSRVLVLTDAESRTPVILVRTNGRAILAGDGGGAPKLTYVRSSDALKEGDRVMTSGDGGVYPRGLPVGTVTKGIDGAWRVSLDADAAPIDDVQILLFKDFAQLVDERALTPRTLPSAMTEEPKQSLIGPVLVKPSAPGAPAAAKPPASVKPQTSVAASVMAKPAKASTAKPGAAGSLGGAAKLSVAAAASANPKHSPKPDTSAAADKPHAARHAKPKPAQAAAGDAGGAAVQPPQPQPHVTKPPADSIGDIPL